MGSCQSLQEDPRTTGITHWVRKIFHVDAEEDNKGVRRALPFQPAAALEPKVRVRGEKAPSSNRSVPSSNKVTCRVRLCVTHEGSAMERRHLLKQLGWYGTRGSMCSLIVTAICVICMVIFAYNKFPHDFPSITDTGKTRMNHVRRSLPATLNPFSSPDFIKSNLWLQYANFTAMSLTNYSCTFCMAARPLLMVIPVPDTPETCASDPHYPSHNHSCKFLCDVYYTNSDTSSKIPEFCGHFFPSSDFTRPPTRFEPPQDVLIPSELNVTDCFISEL